MWVDFVRLPLTLSYMPTTSLTTRIDKALKARLEQIAQREDRSASYIANQAIRALVEEREATLALVTLGLQLAENSAGVSEAAVDRWLETEPDAPFPEPDTTGT